MSVGMWGNTHTVWHFLSYLLLMEGMFVSVPIFYLWSIWYSIAFSLLDVCFSIIYIYLLRYSIALFLGMFVFLYRLLFVTWVDYRYSIALSLDVCFQYRVPISL